MKIVSPRLQLHRYGVLLITILFFSLFFTVDTNAMTVITEREIMVDTTWTKANSPYVIEARRVNVRSGITLMLEPGTIVKLNGHYINILGGTLIAKGTEADPIYVTSGLDDALGGDTNGDGSATMPSMFDGGGVAFYAGSDASQLQHVISQYSGGFYLDSVLMDLVDIHIVHSENGLYIYDSVISLERVTVDDIFRDAIISSYGALTATDVEISNVLDGDAIGMYDSALDLQNSTIHDMGVGLGLGLYSSVANIGNTVFDGGLASGIELYSGSELYISASTVENFLEYGIGIFSGRYSVSSAVVEHSMVLNNDIGIGSFSSDGLFFQNAFEGNGTYGVWSNGGGSSPIDAVGNWWGDASGPMHAVENPGGLGDAVSDDVLFIPWLFEEPSNDEVGGNSNVVFLPGLQASRLYKDEGEENQLWEPNRNRDVKTMFLEVEGNSIDPGIYARDIIDETNLFPPILSGFNIYKSFIELMDGLVNEGTINEWRALPYDWRLDFDDIIEYGVALEDGGRYDMITFIKELAASAQNGKVTIIAHSNGGLLAKALIDELEVRGEADLVDKLILVAVPQLGTPKSITSLLHGDEQEIPKKMGIVLSKETAREFGENMPSGYNLLPSDLYFDRVLDPVVEFDPYSSVVSGFRNLYGDAIDNLSELREFLLGDDGVRSEPTASDTDAINVLNQSLLQESIVTHAVLDPWIPPGDIKIYQIVGWGLDTVRGVRYTERKEFQCNEDLSVCGKVPVLDREPIFTTDGDKTVVTPSANAMESAETFYVDLEGYNSIFRINRTHANIMEVASIRELITDIVQNDFQDLPIHVVVDKPIGTSNLRLSVHSPVSIDIYSSDNSHTGLISATEFDSDLTFVEEQIPNSYYLEFGEGKYVGLDANSIYRAELNGLDFGTFTFEISEVQDDAVIDELIFSDIPVTPSMHGVMTLQTVAGASTLDLDMNGDGDIDVMLGQNDAYDPFAYLEIMRWSIQEFGINTGIKNSLLQRLDAIEKLLTDGKTKPAVNILGSLENSMSGWSHKISVSDVQVILHMFEQLRSLMVQ